MDPVFGAGLEFERLPVRNTPAGSAADCSHGSITLDVLGSVLGVSFDLYRAELEVGPRPTDAPAKRAVAGGCDCGRGRQLQFYSAAMAGTLMHSDSCLCNAGTF